MRVSRRAGAAALASVVLLAVPALARSAGAQGTGTVQGTVTDSATRRGLPGVQVFVRGTQAGTVTNDTGGYVLRGVPAGAAVVATQRIGYAPGTRRVTVATGGSVVADFALRSLAVQLSQVVTIGYGTASRQNVSSAVATVDSTVLSRIPVVAIDNALQGRVAGVQVMQNSGEPGAGVSVRVRGPASLNAGNQPLFVVDGIPIIQSSLNQIAPSGQDVTAITALNPEEIERVDVLKDAAAAAIYGSRGSNGVVMITTKRGAAAGRARFGFSTYAGSQSVERRIPLLGASDYVQVMNESRTNEGRAPLFAPGTDSIDVDWQDAIFRSAPIADAQLTISGGTDRLRAFLSGANFLQRGIVVGSQYARQAARLNLDANATSKLSISTSLSLTREDNDRVPGDQNLDGVVTNAVAMQPFSPVFGQSAGFGGNRENLIYSNPVAVANLYQTQARTLRTLGNIEARYALASRLSATGRAGLDLYALDELQWRSPNVDRGVSSGVGGSGATGVTNASRTVVEGFLNLQALQSDRQQLAIVAGASAERNRTELNFVRGQGFPTGFTTFIRNAATIATFDGTATFNNLVSYFARANYTLLDRYFVSASLRADGSSRFGAENRTGVFPAVSLGWTVTEESWARPLARVGSLKLRGSYGATGNQGIGDFASRALAGGAAAYGTAAGLAGTQLGNPGLRWEQTRETDVGVDLSVLDGRIGVIADWYDRNTTDLLVQRPVPATSGFTTVWDNVGSIRNRGIDLSLRTVNLDEKKGRVGWTTDLNITWNRNTVTDLYQDLPVTFTVSSRITSVAAEGHPLGSFYMFRFVRVDPQTGNAIFARADGTETTSPTSADLQVVGNPQPAYFGGLTNTFTLGRFDLRGFLQFTQGAEVLNMLRIFADDGGNSRDNKTANVLRRWRQPGDVTDVPRMGVGSGARFLSSRMVEDGSFVRLQEVTLGYRLPARLTRGLRLDNARLFVSGRNLVTWTDYTGYNPDVNSGGSTANVVMGVDFYAYPLARTFTFGLNAGF